VIDEHGAVREWVGVHTDITDRRQAEEALRQSEARFRQVAESMPQVVWTMAPDLVCDYVNSRWTELTGCDLEATNARVYRERMLPEDLAVIDRTALRGTLSGEPFSFECRFPCVSDGTLRWHLVRSVPVRNNSGEVIKWLGTSTDIDEQKRAADALSLSEWRLRFTLDAAQFGFWDFDLRTEMTKCSPRCNAIFGYEPNSEEWSLLRFLEHVIPEDRHEVERTFRQSLDDGSEWNCECRISRASDGETRWIWTCGKTIPGEFGTASLAAASMMVGLVGDITDRKQAEAALALANEELTRANSDLEQFGYSVSHDLQEPIRAVTIYSELLSAVTAKSWMARL